MGDEGRFNATSIPPAGLPHRHLVASSGPYSCCVSVLGVTLVPVEPSLGATPTTQSTFRYLNGTHARPRTLLAHQRMKHEGTLHQRLAQHRRHELPRQLDAVQRSRMLPLRSSAWSRGRSTPALPNKPVCAVCSARKRGRNDYGWRRARETFSLVGSTTSILEHGD